MLKSRGVGVMMFRAIICCTALIFALLAALSATAQSAGVPQPLNLMKFMNGAGKSGSTGTASAKTASTSKHRHATTRTAARPYRDVTTSSSEPAMPVAAATAYASQPADDVQVVSGDEVNAIDLAMNNSGPETNGVSSRTDSEARDRFKVADATLFQANQGKPDTAAAPAKETAAGTSDETARADEIARESWINRFWSAIGDGFVALTGMVRQLFG